MTLTQPPRRDRTHRKQAWTLDEARRFLAGAAEQRLYAAFHLALVTGLRRGELLGLRWEDGGPRSARGRGVSEKRSDPPPNRRSLEKRIDNLARAPGRPTRRIQRAVANTIVGQMLPPGVVKGGTCAHLPGSALAHGALRARPR